MKIAIVNQHFHIGGVETFLLSLIRQFERLGHDVDVFLLEMNYPNALLPDLRNLRVGIKAFDSIRIDGDKRPFDVALVTNPETLFETLRQIELGRLQVGSVIVGVYQTRMYCLDRGPFNLHNRLTREIFSRMPVENAVFGNDACRDEHAKMTPSMVHAPMIPLIVDVDRFPRRPPRDPAAPRRIVSIGRLDHFKTYNLTMPDVIRQLREKGHDVGWDVYGTGMLQPEMEQRIAECGIGSAVRLLGNIDYASIPRILADAFAFVGSGLSMMEAAACGVPALPAVEYDDRPETFGFPHEIEGISFFEPGLRLPRHNLVDKLARLIGASPAEYEAIGDACREKMSFFFPASIAERYIEIFQKASFHRPAVGALRFGAFKASAMIHRDGSAMLKRLGLRKR